MPIVGRVRAIGGLSLSFFFLPISGGQHSQIGMDIIAA